MDYLCKRKNAAKEVMQAFLFPPHPNSHQQLESLGFSQCHCQLDEVFFRIVTPKMEPVVSDVFFLSRLKSCGQLELLYLRLQQQVMAESMGFSVADFQDKLKRASDIWNEINPRFQLYLGCRFCQIQPSGEESGMFFLGVSPRRKFATSRIEGFKLDIAKK